MAENSDQIIQQNAAIKQQLATVIALAEQYEKASTQNSTKEVTSAHTALCAETHKLLRTVRGPLDSVWSHFENVRI